MNLSAVMTDITQDLLAISLFCLIGTMIIAQDLAHLIHKFSLPVRTEYRLIFHIIPFNIIISGK